MALNYKIGMFDEIDSPATDPVATDPVATDPVATDPRVTAEPAPSNVVFDQDNERSFPYLTLEEDEPFTLPDTTSVPKRNVRDKQDNYPLIDTVEGFGSNMLDAGLGSIANLVYNEITKSIENVQQYASSNINPDGTFKENFEDKSNRNVFSPYLNPRQYENIEYVSLFSDDPDKRIMIARGVGDKIKAEGGFQKYIESGGSAAGYMAQFSAINLAIAKKLSKDPAIIRRITAELQAGAKDFWSALGQAPQAMIQNYLKTPASAIALDVGIGATGGFGDQAERDITGREQTTGIGFFAGSLSPFILTAAALKSYNYSPIRFTAEKVKEYTSGFLQRSKDAYSRYTDPKVKASQQTSKQAKIARAESGKQIVKAIEEGERTGRVQQARTVEQQINKSLEEGIPEANIPGADDNPFRFTVAEQTFDPLLVATERKVIGRMTPDEIRANEKRLQQFENGVENFKQNTFGDDDILDSGIGYVIDPSRNNVEQLLSKVDDAIGAASATIKNTVPSLNPKYSAATAGAEVRQTIIGAREASIKRMDEIADDLGINKLDPVAPNSRVVTAQNKIKNQILTSEGEASLSYAGTNDLIKRFLDFKGNLTFQDWKAFRDDVGSEINKVLGFGNQPRQLRDLFSFSKVLDELAANNTKGEGFRSANKALQKFNEIYGREHINVFERGVAVRLRSKDQGSIEGAPVYVTADEAVLDSFLANTTTAKEFLKLAENNPELYIAMGSQIDNRIAQSAMNLDNTVNVRNLNNHLNKNKEVYELIGTTPGLGDNRKILTLASTRHADLQNRRKKIETNSVVRALINEFKGSKTLDQAFDTAMQSPRNFTDWIRRVKKAEKEAGVDLQPAFRQMVIQKIMQKVQPDKNEIVKYGAFIQELEKLKPILLGVRRERKTLQFDENQKMLVSGKKQKTFGFDKEHMDNLEMLFAMSEMQNTLKVQGKLAYGKGIEPSEGFTEKILNQFGFTPAGLTSLTRSLQESRVGLPFFLIYTTGRTLSAQNKIAQDALIKEAILYPEVAKLLTSKIAPQGPTPKQTKDLESVLFRIGSDYTTSKTIDETFLEPAGSPTIEIPTPTKVQPPEQKPQPDSVYLKNMETSQRSPAPMPTSTPVASNQPRQNLGIEELFPFDSTSAAIAKRRNANQGIAGLV
jgi:hypothetical protein